VGDGEFVGVVVVEGLDKVPEVGARGIGEVEGDFEDAGARAGGREVGCDLGDVRVVDGVG